MDINNVKIRTVNGRRFVRIPREFRLSGDTVFMYWEGFSMVVAPVDGPAAEEERKMAQWAIEHGDDIPPKSPEASP